MAKKKKKINIKYKKKTKKANKVFFLRLGHKVNLEPELLKEKWTDRQTGKETWQAFCH